MRLFICDPVCVLPFGHNAVALNYFRSAFADRYDTIPLCGRALPQSIVESYAFVPFFHYYYHDFITLPAGQLAPLPPRMGFPASYVDELEALATDDATRLLAEYDMGSKDTIFFPSVDFYSLVGLLNALQGWPERRRPRLLLRFIGVMETSTNAHRNPMAHLAHRLMEARAQGIAIAFSAETPRLAVYLSELLDSVVLVTPYPEMAEPLPESTASDFIVFCPGAARFDKGFMELQSIFWQVRRNDPDLEIGFVTQALSLTDAVHQQNYISQVYAIPGVELLAPAISPQEMRQRYLACSLVLLPYDTKTYRMRGSAVLMETACLARPILTIEGAAFAEQVAYYGLGTVVPSASAMPEAILSLARSDRSKLYRRALHARQRFALDVVSVYDNWLRSAA
jgi:hypothetical protein